MSNQMSPPIAYGFWRYEAEELNLALNMLECARLSGITHFDTADVYGGPEAFGAAETLLGEARLKAPSLFEGCTVATKVGVEFGTPYNSSKDYITRAVDSSFSRLKTENIDLLYIHRPDLLTHPAELADILDGLIQDGKIAAVGVSNFTIDQVSALKSYMQAPLAAHQIEFSLLATEPLFDGRVDQAMATKIPLYAWSPLAGGRLFSSDEEIGQPLASVLGKMAQEKKCSKSALALAFLLKHPVGVRPIIGTKNAGRLKEAALATSISLERSDWYQLLEASRGRPMP